MIKKKEHFHPLAEQQMVTCYYDIMSKHHATDLFHIWFYNELTCGCDQSNVVKSYYI